MKLGYITQYGWWKNPTGNPKDAVKQFEEFGKALKKANVELLFFAGAYGVTEPAMYAVKFNDIKDWEKIFTMPEVYQANPLDRTRTVFGWDFKD